MIGKKILHYNIIEKLGEGGMGIVYLAEDTKLERKVAIKFLPRNIASNSDERKRFEIEAKAAAALNHPNIATIHAIEHSEDDVFIVMEYIEGQTLQEKISADRQLPPADCVDMAIQIAAGLQAAHEKGIVHRDIKSSNIMITEKGQVKIMDFGLAKVHGTAQLTQIGTTVGTIAYMSPEQARGEVVDQRTDIWSFGVLLYELLTGRQPFKGDYEQAIIYCIVNEPFEPVHTFRSDLPAELENILGKALAKSTGDRYQQVAGMAEDLKKLNFQSTSTASDSKTASAAGTTAEVPNNKNGLRIRVPYIVAAVLITLLSIAGYFIFTGDKKIDSLAVLPFVNASQDPDTEYLSDGVTANLINRLSELTGLKVMSRHSIARFKEGDHDPLSAGRQLAVRSVLTGHLDIRGENLLVDVELLDVDDGRQLWGDRFERNRTDILTVERDIVKRIGDKLKMRFARDDSDDNQDDTDIDPMAYDLYLRGRYIMLGTTDDGPARAQEFFRQAIEREPRLAVAHAGLGESYVSQAWLNSRDRDEIVPLAKASLKKAIDLDPGLSEVHILAGEIALYFDWDWSAAEEGYRKAIELNPGSDLAHREYSNFLLAMGDLDKAIAEARIAQSLDPLSVYGTHQVGWSLLATGRLSEAAVEFRKAIDLNPTWVWGNIKLGMACALMGDKENATYALARADELLAGKLPSPLAQSWLAQIAYMCGDEGRIKETIARLQSQAELTFIDPYALADMFFLVGDQDKMFQYLEKSFEIRSSLMPMIFLDGKFFWKKINKDPRYLSLLERMNFPAQN